MANQLPVGNAVSLREVYGLINSTKAELMAEIQKIASHFDAQLAKHDNEHNLHERLHEAEKTQRSSYIRWAVTSIMTGIGVVAAIIIPIVTR